MANPSSDPRYSPQLIQHFRLLSREILKLTITENLPFSFCEKIVFRRFIAGVLSCISKPDPQKAIVEECAKLIAAENMSLGLGERPQFVEFLRFCHPPALPVPLKTLVLEMKSFYQKEKMALIETFSKLEPRVSVSVDMWADAGKDSSFLCVSCHWIDENWALQKRLILFESFYDKDQVFGRVNDRLNEYGLSGKVSSIGFDNACLKITSLDVLRNFFDGIQFCHGKYASHVLNVASLEALIMLDEFVAPITTALQHFEYDESLLKKWFRFCQLHGRKKMRFQTCNPEWHLAYILLSEASEYSTLLCSFFASNQPGCEMKDLHWSVCKKIVKVFAVVRRMILILSSVYASLSNLFITEACKLVAVLHEFRNDEHLKVAVTSILIEWLSCYRTIPPAFLVAAVFDPRVRLDSLRASLSEYYDNISEFSVMDDDDHHVSIDDVMNEVSSLTYQLYNDKKHGSEVQGSELEMYLSASFGFTEEDYKLDFKVLDWWKQKSEVYPTLSRIAKEVLASSISVSGGKEDQVFSVEGNVLDERRTQVGNISTKGLLEVQTLVGDWVKASFRDQEIMVHEFYDPYVDSDEESA